MTYHHSKCGIYIYSGRRDIDDKEEVNSRVSKINM